MTRATLCSVVTRRLTSVSSNVSKKLQSPRIYNVQVQAVLENPVVQAGCKKTPAGQPSLLVCSLATWSLCCEGDSDDQLGFGLVSSRFLGHFSLLAALGPWTQVPTKGVVSFRMVYEKDTFFEGSIFLFKPPHFTVDVFLSKLLNFRLVTFCFFF